MSYKKFICFCLILCILSISGVSAADTCQQSIDNNLAVSYTDDFNAADNSYDMAEVLGDEISTNVSGTFTDLNNAISSSNDIVLTGDVSRISGEEDIYINKSVLIDGNGYTIDAKNLGRAFIVLPDGELTLSNVRIINADSLQSSYNDTAAGGSILNLGTLITNDCTFEKNHAESGGAIAASSNSFTSISDSNTFTLNTADTYGGAISVTGRAVLNISGKNIFANNSATNGGGALFLNTLSNVSLMDHCYFYDNRAMGNRGSGGAILAVSNSPLDLKGHLFSGNNALYGGAVCVNNTQLNAMYNIFMSNTVLVSGSDIEIFNSPVDSLDMNYWGSQSKPNNKRIHNYDVEDIDSWVILKSVIPSEILRGQNTNIINFVQDSEDNISDPLPDFEMSVTPDFTPNPLIISNNKGFSTYNGNSTSIGVSISGPGFFISQSVKVLDGIVETSLSGSDVLMFSGESKYYIVTLKDNDGDILPNQIVRFIFNGNSFSQSTNGVGQASLMISNITPGNYTINAVFDGTEGYVNSSTSNTIMVFPRGNTNVRINASDVTMFYHDGSRYVVTLTDNDGNPLNGLPVKILINGLNYNRVTNATGQVSSPSLGLPSGKYNLSAYFSGDDVYSPVFIKNILTINPTVASMNITKYFGNATQYYAAFKNQQGNYLPNGTEVEMNINGVIYKRKVNGNAGLVKLNINLPPGEYILTATNPVTRENVSNTIKVLSIISHNKDITKYYRNDTQYTVKLLDNRGKPAAGDKVTFNINGVFYTRTADEKGFATLNINLPPGDYIITATYKGCSVSNNIKVITTLIGQNITMAHGVQGQFKVILLNGLGQRYPDQKVSFNINGVLYTRTTDAEGAAFLNINLPSGRYIITSTYDGLSISNTVAVI